MREVLSVAGSRLCVAIPVKTALRGQPVVVHGLRYALQYPSLSFHHRMPVLSN
jgi:hypothetical protein